MTILYYIKMFLLACSSSVILIPCLISIMLIVQPDHPPFPGRLILSSAVGQENPITVLLLSVVNFALMANLTGSTVISVIYGPFIELIAVIMYLRKLKERMKWHNKTVILTRKEIEQRLLRFKQIQLLVLSFNECYKWMFTTGFLFYVYFIISVYLYAVVKFHKLISLPNLMFLLQLWMEGVALTFVVNSMAGQVYHSSCLIKKDFLRQPSVTVTSVSRNRWLKRKVKACSGMKIRVGSVNFIDRLTPFIMISICAKVTVRLLMTV
jgi:hypothetical protein